MQEEKTPYILTEEEQKQVSESLEKVVKDNENLRILSELPSNNGVEEHESETGVEKFVNVSIDPKTGEKRVMGEVDKPEPEDISDVLERAGEKANTEDFMKDYEFKPDDVKKVAEEDTIVGKFDISDETALELVNLLNDIKISGKKVTYTMLPAEVKEIVNDYCSKNGVAGFSVESNTIRNNIAELLIDNFVDNIQMNNYLDDFNKELEDIYKSTGEEISPLIKEYNESRIDMINKACEKIDDPEKKETVAKTLDAINDAYELKAFIEAAPRIKVKKFYLEKPKKVFDSFLYKYKETNYNIYDLGMVLQVLHRHLISNKIIEETDTESALKIIIAFCLYSKGFKPENPEEHAFMYYFTYNIVLLDIYKADQYNQFADKFLSNIKTVLDNLK